jgi:predicted Holliday junction resolvase-like endonuclease
MTALLVVALILAIAVIAWLLNRQASYRVAHKWSDDDLSAARHDSVNRSRSVVSGKVREHLAPLCPEFLEQFNPKDARFLGTPVDFIVFDGLDAGYVQNVCFVEVKTGRASMSSRERHVRAAIEAGKVSFQVVRLPSVGSEAFPTLAANAKAEVPEAPPALQ